MRLITILDVLMQLLYLYLDLPTLSCSLSAVSMNNIFHCCRCQWLTLCTRCWHGVQLQYKHGMGEVVKSGVNRLFPVMLTQDTGS